MKKRVALALVAVTWLSLFVAVCASAFAESVGYSYVIGTTTNSTLVKIGSGRLKWIYAGSTSAAANHIKFYDKATAPVCGTDIPIARFVISGLAAGGPNLQLPTDMIFQKGLGFCVVTGAADNATTAATAGPLVTLGID